MSTKLAVNLSGEGVALLPGSIRVVVIELAQS
jgi:hypothetical protein